jgi:hypothetical protein
VWLDRKQCSLALRITHRPLNPAWLLQRPRKVNLLAVAVKLAVAYSSNSSKLQILIKVLRREFRVLWLALQER